MTALLWTIGLGLLGALVTGLSARQGWLPERWQAGMHRLAGPFRADRRGSAEKQAAFERMVQRELRWRRNIPTRHPSGNLVVYCYPREGGDVKYASGDLRDYKRGVQDRTIDFMTTFALPPSIEGLPNTHEERIVQLQDLRIRQPELEPPKEWNAGPLPKG